MLLTQITLIVTLGLLAIYSLCVKGARRPFELLVLIAFFLPFERIPTVVVNDFTLKINHGIGVIFLVFWFLDRAIHRKEKCIPNPLAIPILLLVGSLFLSLTHAVLLSRGIIFTVQILFTIFLGVATHDSIRRKEHIDIIERVILASAWVVVAFGLWQFVGDFLGLPHSVTGLDVGFSKVVFGFPRVQAFSKEPLYLANYLFIPMGFLIGSFFSGKKVATHKKWLLAGICVVILLTMSRGGIIGFIAAGGVGAFIWAKKVFTVSNFFMTAFGVIAILGSVFIGLTAYGNGGVQRYIEHITIGDIGQGESTVSRLSAVSESIEIWKEHPIIGIGIGNFGGSQTGFDTGDPRTKNIVNNEYFELLAETGILGLGSFVALCGVLFARSIRAVRETKNERYRSLTIGLTLALFGILVQYNFFSTLSIIYIWVFIGIVTAVQTCALKENQI